jgi:hypothetical protein
MDLGAQNFNSLCRLVWKIHEFFFIPLPGFKSRAKAAFEVLVIYWLGEVTNDAVLQRALAECLIRVCGNEDRRNCVARIDEISVELNAGHARHLNVGDQASGFRKEW